MKSAFTNPLLSERKTMFAFKLPVSRKSMNLVNSRNAKVTLPHMRGIHHIAKPIAANRKFMRGIPNVMSNNYFLNIVLLLK